jgi:hypothetical protein
MFLKETYKKKTWLTVRFQMEEFDEKEEGLHAGI